MLKILNLFKIELRKFTVPKTENFFSVLTFGIEFSKNMPLCEVEMSQKNWSL